MPTIGEIKLARGLGWDQILAKLILVQSDDSRPSSTP